MKQVKFGWFYEWFVIAMWKGWGGSGKVDVLLGAWKNGGDAY